MKKQREYIHLLYLITFLLLFVASSYSQQISEPVGEVSIYDVELLEKSDTLHVKMNIRVVAKTMNDCQSWKIEPELINKEIEEKEIFPYVLINGKTKEKLYERRLVFKDSTLLNNLPYLKEVSDPLYGNTLTYSYSLPYRSWMDSASLRIKQVLISCANQEQWFLLENLSGVKTEDYIPYIPSPVVNYIEPEKTVKHRQIQGEAFLDFSAGRSAIDPNYRRNPVELDKINQSVSEVVNDENMLVTELLIEGYASPDGSYALNEKLSKERAMALKNYLQNRYRLSNNQMTVESVAEDWQGLKVLIEDSFLSDKDQILSIIDGGDLPDRKEQRLKGLGSWRVLLNDYFPRLRRVKYQIDYKVRDFSAEEAESLLQQNPGHLNQSELFTVAESFGINSERWHEVMQLTVLLFPDDPISNINMAASYLERRELDAAKRYLEKVGERKEAMNNLGVYYLLKGEADKAEECFRKSEGVEAIDVNLKEVELLLEDQLIQQRRKER